MADITIDAIPVGASQSIFRKIKLVDKGDYFEVWRNGLTYVGDIQEQAETELWKSVAKPGREIELYAGSRAMAAELTIIIYNHVTGETW